MLNFLSILLLKFLLILLIIDCMNGALVKKWMSEQGDNGLKPEELAVKLDVSYSTVRSIMAGKKPYQNTVKVLASLMGVSVQELLKEPKKATSSKKVTVD